MADQSSWFKLWCSSIADADLDNLDIADFGRWAKLGAYVKQHGTNGKITIQAPARTLCSILQVTDFAALHAAVSRLPNIRIDAQNLSVSDETILTVSFCNWAKYQGDFSTNRVRKSREMKRNRREESRREESRREESKTKTSKEVLDKPPQKRLPKAPAATPPEIKAIRETTLRYPPKHLWPELEKRAEGLTKEQMANAFTEWQLRGYSPTNYSWLDWAWNGIPPNRGAPRAEQPKTSAALDKALNILRGNGRGNDIDITGEHQSSARTPMSAVSLLAKRTRGTP